MRFRVVLSSLTALFHLTLAQYPSAPTGLTSLQSKIQPGVQIDYKETHICETTPGVKAYSGYVHLPASTLQDVGDYNISTFFWFFEARHNPDTAPLAIYLAGGPGVSSAYAAVSSESGPCYVNIDGNSTTINPWSFNNHVNVLYIDQPVQAGFSYDTLIHGTYDVIGNNVTPLDANGDIPELNSTFGLGTYASQDPTKVTNNTVASARALWHFAENWLTQFPQYKPKNKKISIWGNSYGGYMVPASAAYFDKQIKQSSKHCPLHNFTMDTVGITNGCIDMLYQSEAYLDYAVNNTYGFELLPHEVVQEASHNFTKPGGCRDLIEQCRQLGAEGDPGWIGANATVNEACILATVYCVSYVIEGFSSKNRSVFDIAVEQINGSDPCPYYLPTFPWFNQASVQQDMGVPVNFTVSSNPVLIPYTLELVHHPFNGTGDAFRKGMEDLEYTLQSGMKVAMVYGDRDYRCNWIGAEDVAMNLNYPGHNNFVHSGYERIVTNSTYNGGVVKQHGKLSFSRVFQAGHTVSDYQPETVYRIFMRSMFDRDVATGKQSIAGTKYSSTGPGSSRQIREELPQVPPTCMVEGQFQNVSVWAGILS